MSGPTRPAATFISLEKAHLELGWPRPEDIRAPAGPAAEVFATLAREKIGRALRQLAGAHDATISVLMANPEATDTEPPLAVVAEFKRSVQDSTLRELHRLAWNFSHSPAIITLEPGLLRVWSTCEPPDSARSVSDYVVYELGPPDLLDTGKQTLERHAAQALHWVNLVSGEFFRARAGRFNRDGRADQMLLRNLRYIRQRLADAGLKEDDVCHDLLARIIFVQFLFDRKDSDGHAALNATKLGRLTSEGVLRRMHSDLPSVLGDFDDTYRLFDWLNERFNGDLFPGKGDTATARAKGWASEKRIVTKAHLALLAQFVRGDIDMPSGQGCLWPQYSFDAIPLEFISSIYETFVNERAASEGIFYTPPHLVDFVLDQVLPWNSDCWDLTLLDPACGSGIFLVKAFQRLIHRWKRANPGQQIRAETLRRLLERNVLGVDKDPHAVRVACFSLYLAMCDEIDPRHYWTQVVFPPMRNRRLICSDFFEENRVGFRTEEDAGSFDLIVGNAPWGEKLLTDAARRWASQQRWPLANHGIGTLFLPKAAHLLKVGGKAAIIQSASSLLFNRQQRAANFRKRFFTAYRVYELVNLSALRFKVFKRKTHAVKTSVSPACVVIFGADQPILDDRITYTSPKQVEQLVDEFQIVVEPHDRRELSVRQATGDVTIWTALMWGGHRDLALLKRLRAFPSLAAPGADREVRHREGIIFGDRGKSQPKLRGRRILEATNFPPGLLHLTADDLPTLSEVDTDSRASTDFSAFSWPQLVIKQSWQKEASRFQARLTRSARHQAILCTQSYVTVNASSLQLLEAAGLSLNSIIATYFLFLTSGRFATYRPETLVTELLAVPIPQPRAGLLAGLSSVADIDARAFEAFALKDAERVLVEDLFAVTLADFRGDTDSPGRQRTARARGQACEPDLRDYCKYFSRVLKAGFGSDKTVNVTIFQEGQNETQLPYRLIAFQLNGKVAEKTLVTQIRSHELLTELSRLDLAAKSTRADGSGIYHQRVARVYEIVDGAPTVFVVKPDMRRYWTRSAGLNDGDEVALDLYRWSQMGTQARLAS